MGIIYKNMRVIVRNMREVEITQEPVELYKILKFEGMVSSGGEAKLVIEQGQVCVNGKVETRKRKKNNFRGCNQICIRKNCY